MPSFLTFLKQHKLPSLKTFGALISGPLTRIKVLLCILTAAVIITAYALIVTLNNHILITVPAHGGSASIGIIGAPRYLNPLLATTDTDQSIDAIVYAGVMKMLPNGEIVPELAKSYILSPDGKNYTFTLRDKLRFHDGTHLTSADIAFTIQKLQDSTLNKDTSAYWQSVNVENPDEHTVVIRLPSPDTAFLQKMTFGVISQKEWQDIPLQEWFAHSESTLPNGSGPFRVTAIDRNGDAISTITLTRASHYPLKKPYLKTIQVKSFPNQQKLRDALTSGDVAVTMALDSHTLADTPLPSRITTASVPTPDTVGIYRLPNDPVLANAAFTTALDQYIDKSSILATVEHGYGALETSSSPSSLENTLTQLEQLGYKRANGVLTYRNSPVGFSIVVENDEERLNTARALAEELEKLGMIITVKAFDHGAFQDALHGNTYGIVLAHKSDLPTATQYRTALLLYRKALPYATHNIYGVAPHTLEQPVLRYANIGEWYALTDRLWPGLVRHTEQ